MGQYLLHTYVCVYVFMKNTYTLSCFPFPRHITDLWIERDDWIVVNFCCGV
jgi:hypothetical protein